MTGTATDLALTALADLNSERSLFGPNGPQRHISERAATRWVTDTVFDHKLPTTEVRAAGWAGPSTVLVQASDLHLAVKVERGVPQHAVLADSSGRILDTAEMATLADIGHSIHRQAIADAVRRHPSSPR